MDEHALAEVRQRCDGVTRVKLWIAGLVEEAAGVL
jgi:hypothetical protein